MTSPSLFCVFSLSLSQYTTSMYSSEIVNIKYHQSNTWTNTQKAHESPGEKKKEERKQIRLHGNKTVKQIRLLRTLTTVSHSDSRW